MKRNTLRKLTAAVICIIICISFTACSGKVKNENEAFNIAGSYFAEQKGNLQTAALDYIANSDGNIKVSDKYELWQFECEGSDFAVFDFKNGWCSKISYGLYYSTSDHPANISTYNYDLKEADNGWFAEETEKYYPYYTEKLMDNWYFYYIGNNSNN